MISREKGRDIAGQILIEKYGQEYLVENKEKLSFIESVEENMLTVKFTLHENLDKAIVEMEGGICVEEKHFPKVLLTVNVDLNNEIAKVIE